MKILNRYRFVIVLVLIISKLTATGDDRLLALDSSAMLDVDSFQICEEHERLGQSIKLTCDFDLDRVSSDELTIVYSSDLAQSNLVWTDPALQEESVWLFDVHANDTIDFAIGFEKQGKSVVASLYSLPSDELLTGLLDTVSDPFRSTSELFPNVRVVAKDGWWSTPEKINFDLDIFVDGPIVSAFLDKGVLDYFFSVDGITDTTIMVRDDNNDGHPNSDWRTVHFPEDRPAFARNAAQSFLVVNVDDDEQAFDRQFPWPYLGNKSFGYLTNSAEATGPPIQVDWQTGEITAIGEFVRSRSNDSQWFVYSQKLLAAGSLNEPNFESPFAWYDLAGDDDGVPELAVRLIYFDSEDPDFLGEKFRYPFNHIRYSWDEDNDGFWDYKFGLFGRHKVTSIVHLPDLDLRMQDYHNLPQWVVGSDWEAVTFVASEDGSQGEGIYEWDFSSWTINEYFTGISEDYIPHDENMMLDSERLFNELSQISVGFRGEYQLNHSGRVILYFSPVDNRLHLKGADQGIWRLNNDQIIRVSNLDRDEFIDHWSREIMPDSKIETNERGLDAVEASFPGETVEELYALDDLLIHQGDSEVTIVEAEYTSSLFETVPPANRESWESNHDLLLPYEGIQRDPFDLSAWVHEFHGRVEQISGASVTNVHSSNGEIRFELTLEQNYRVHGSNLLSLENAEVELQNNNAGQRSAQKHDQLLPVGRYIIIYNKGHFKIKPYETPSLSMRFTAPILEGKARLELLPQQLVITNHGETQATDIFLETSACHEDFCTELITQTLSIPAGGVQKLLVDWQQPTYDEVDLHAKIFYSDGQEAAAITTTPSGNLWGSRTYFIRGNSKTSSLIIAIFMLIAIAFFVGKSIALNRWPNDRHPQ